MSNWPIRVLVYGAGDAINGQGALDQQISVQLARLSSVATNRTVAAAAQLDSNNALTLRYVLDPARRQPVDQLPDVDTGDPAELVRFVEWGAATLPAERSVLVLAGHGVAWQDDVATQVLGRTIAPTPHGESNGSSTPKQHVRRLFGARPRPPTPETAAILVDGSYRDFLSNSELAFACERVAQTIGGPVDVLVMDACLMMSWEIAQELAGTVRTIVGSIDELSASGIDLAQPVYELSTTATEALTSQDIASKIVKRFSPKAPFDTCVAVDVSVGDWRSAIDSFRTFCAELLPWIRSAPTNADLVRGALRIAATSVVKFALGGLADVGALAAAMNTIAALPPPAGAAIHSAVSALQKCVLARSTGADYESALGISVFCPSSVTTYSSNSAEYNRLHFGAMSGWRDVLAELYAKTT
jgi:Clostripain family